MVNLTAALAPVLCLLVLLIVMDSFKLVAIRFVLQAIVGGMAAAGVALFVNTHLIDTLAVPTSKPCNGAPPRMARVPEPKRALPRTMLISLPSTLSATAMSLSGVARPCNATSPLVSSNPPW